MLARMPHTRPSSSPLFRKCGSLDRSGASECRRYSAGTVPVMSQKRKPRAAKPRDLSFGAVQRKLAAKGAAAAAASSPRASKKTPLQIEKLIEKPRNANNKSCWEVCARSPGRSPRLTCAMRSTWCAGAASIRPKIRCSPPRLTPRSPSRRRCANDCRHTFEPHLPPVAWVRAHHVRRELLGLFHRLGAWGR